MTARYEMVRAIDPLELRMLHGGPCGNGPSAVPTDICEMERSGFARLDRTQPQAISNQAGSDFDTSSADRRQDRRNPHSTSERKRTLHQPNTRLPAAVPVTCNLLVGVHGEGE